MFEEGTAVCYKFSYIMCSATNCDVSEITASSSSTSTVRYGVTDVHSAHVSAPMTSERHYARVTTAFSCLCLYG